jgi:hypothetical protein
MQVADLAAAQSFSRLNVALKPLKRPLLHRKPDSGEEEKRQTTGPAKGFRRFVPFLHFPAYNFRVL